MRIIIQTIPHSKQRYETVGDWLFVGDDLHILVSELGDWREEALVAVHELNEVLICKHKGISQEKVDEFDMLFEKNRVTGDESEPGDDPKAPYREQHQFATQVERALSAKLDIEWEIYEKHIQNLSR